jgi:hypothetical protein
MAGLYALPSPTRLNALLTGETDPGAGTVIERIEIHYGRPAETMFGLDDMVAAG